MKLKFLLFLALSTLTVLSGCTNDSRESAKEYGNLSSLVDSITITPIRSGRYSLAFEFFDKLTNLRQAEGIDSVHSVLLTFFSRLHPEVRITDSLAVLQTLEWIHNCFTLMDSGGVFFTNGDADTYASWYLQQVMGIRPDLIVISLPFLIGTDYRQYLKEDERIRSALNLSEGDSLPIPPSTSETQDALVDIVTHMISNPKHPPVYMAPSCGIPERFGEHVVDLGLVYTYQDTVQSKGKILDLLLFKLRQDWELRYASQGSPKDSSYATQVAWLQYLTMLMRMAPEFEKAKRYEDLDTLFTYMEPVVGENWRFPALRYMYCHQAEEQCNKHLEKLRKHAADHPEDRAVQATLKQLENQ